MKSLLGSGNLSRLSPTTFHLVSGRAFFPKLLAASFGRGLIGAFLFAALICVMGATLSLSLSWRKTPASRVTMFVIIKNKMYEEEFVSNDIVVYSRTVVPFTSTGEIDEDGFREYLRRLVRNNIAVYLAACGPCEGFTLSNEEISRIYKIGVEECKGKVFVGGSGKEQHTAKDTLEIVQLGIDAGLDSINVYGPSGWHGYEPTEAEFLNYYDRILSETNYSTSMAPNPAIGYRPSARSVAAVCNKYPQVNAVILAGIYEDGYLISLKDSLTRDVDFLITLPTALTGFELGSRGLIAYQSQFIPNTYRSFIDLYSDGNLAEAMVVYSQLRNYEALVVSEPAWKIRWCKMAMRAFKLPGGEGTFREPCLMPENSEVSRFAKALIDLDIPEINEMASASGLN